MISTWWRSRRSPRGSCGCAEDPAFASPSFGYRRSRLITLFPRHRRPELPESMSEGASGLREPFGCKDQEDDGQDQQQMGWLKDVAKHGGVLSGVRKG